jgi:fumarate reductase subunit D
MARSNEPIWYLPFSLGLGVSALIVPALVLITGFLFPWLRPQDANSVQGLIHHPLTRVFLFVVIFLSFFTCAHRLRMILIDLGVIGGQMIIAVLCYGSAILGTVIALVVAIGLWP